MPDADAPRVLVAETLALIVAVGFDSWVAAVRMGRVSRRPLVVLACMSVALVAGCGSSTTFTTQHIPMQASSANHPTRTTIVTQATRDAPVVPSRPGSEPEASGLTPVPTTTTTAPSTPVSVIADPPADAGEGVVREGDAAMEVVLERLEISQRQQIALRLVNRGEVDLLTGLDFEVERWDGRRWIPAWGRGRAWPAIGIGVPPGESTKPQTWPSHDDDYELKPGWYRIAKSATYAEDQPLLGRTRFRVHPAP